MLHELLKLRFSCPVCGRILYPHKIRGYWCPFCGTDLKLNTDQEQTKTVDLTNRITSRDENGVPVYIGEHQFRSRSYPEDINITAISEILEKLCQYEELDEEQENNT